MLLTPIKTFYIQQIICRQVYRHKAPVTFDLKGYEIYEYIL